MTLSRKPVIGLVGGPGSGKSHVARLFAQLGCGVVDADALAKQALDEPTVRDQLVRWWGRSVLGEEGGVDRKAVAAIVFDRPDELAKLEALVHPRVHARRRELYERWQKDPEVPAIIEDTPLLLEKNLEDVCDVLVFVEAPREVRLERVARTRGWDERELAAREKNQLPLDSKRIRSDHVIDNGGDEAHALGQVRRLLSRIIPESPSEPPESPDTFVKRI